MFTVLVCPKSGTLTPPEVKKIADSGDLAAGEGKMRADGLAHGG
jgi:hypothetical protein